MIKRFGKKQLETANSQIEAQPTNKKHKLWFELSQNAGEYFFMLPFVIIFLVFTVVPVASSMILSFTSFNVLEPPRFVGLENYFNLLLDDKLFLMAFKNTLIIAMITGPVNFFLCLLLAWVVNEFNPKLRAFLTLLFYAPSISGGVFMIWQIIYSGDVRGVLNGILLRLNIIYEPIQWLTDTKYMLNTCIIVIFWMSLGTSFLSFIAGYQNVDKTLFEAGAVDGIKNRWQELWFITLPSMRPQLMFGAVLSITGSFGMGDMITGLFGFPSTNYTLWTMVHHLQDYGNIRMEMGYASAIATILFLIMIFANKVVQKLLHNLGN